MDDLVFAIVTVKLPQNGRSQQVHWGHSKTRGKCPLRQGGVCTDVTGNHHSYIEFGESIDEIQKKAEKDYGHVTRIEARRLNVEFQGAYHIALDKIRALLAENPLALKKQNGMKVVSVLDPVLCEEEFDVWLKRIYNAMGSL